MGEPLKKREGKKKYILNAEIQEQTKTMKKHRI